MLLVNPRTRVQLEFIADIASVSIKFLTLYQTEGLLVHLLHSSLSDLVSMLLLRFMLTAVIETKTGYDLVDLNSLMISLIVCLRLRQV